MSDHNHHCCKHAVKLCEHCNIVYCAKCRFEWKEPCKLYHGYNWTYSIPANTTTVTAVGSLATSGTLNAQNDSSSVIVPTSCH